MARPLTFQGRNVTTGPLLFRSRYAGLYTLHKVDSLLFCLAFGHGSGGSAHEEIAAYRGGGCLGRVDLERHGIIGLDLDRLQVVIDIRYTRRNLGLAVCVG